MPFIFFSAKTEKSDIRAGIDAGADDYLIKPFELDDLLVSITTCLHKKQSS
ncbi:MAG: response regulator [Maribacter sp.]|uniref:response regulator n=1 Tax=Maribacter sp. TaxID=1897614 RepID=UPI003C742D5F